MSTINEISEKKVSDLDDLERCKLSYEWRDQEIPKGITFDSHVIKSLLRNPSSYGTQISNKIIESCETLVRKSKPSLNESGNCIILKTGEAIEIKTSFESKKGLHRITHIRPYEKNKFLLMVFVSRESLTYRMYLIPANLIGKLFKLTAMNGTKLVNMVNKNVNMATTIKSEDVDKIFSECNVLKGTTIRNFNSFISSYVKIAIPKVIVPQKHFPTLQTLIHKTNIVKRTKFRKKNWLTE